MNSNTDKLDIFLSHRICFCTDHERFWVSFCLHRAVPADLLLQQVLFQVDYFNDLGREAHVGTGPR
jgi:hypothetical protein